MSLFKKNKRFESLYNLHPSDSNIPFTKGMHLLWKCDQKLQKAFDISTKDGAILYASWLCCNSNNFKLLKIQEHIHNTPIFIENACTSLPVSVGSQQLPAFLYATWLRRDDLQEELDITDFEGIVKFYGWFLQNKEIFPFTENDIKTVLIQEITHKSNIPLFLYALWMQREDLRNAYDIDTQEGIAGLTGWFLQNKNVVNIHTSCISEFITQPLPHFNNIPFFLYALWLQCENLKNTYNINTLKGIAGLTGWFLQNKNAVDVPTSYISEFITQPLACLNDIPLFLYALWLQREDLQAAFTLHTAKAADDFMDWWVNYGSNEAPDFIVDSVMKNVSKDTQAGYLKQESYYELPSSSQQATHLNNITELPYGINIIGFPFSSSGLASDLRMLVEIIQFLNIPFCIIETPYETPSKKTHVQLETFLNDVPLYNTTIFCLPADEIFKTLCYFEDFLFSNQILIGQTPWEFSEFLPHQNSIIQLLDATLALSDFIAHALHKIPNTKVYKITRYIKDISSEILTNSHTSTKEPFTFFFMWDGLSSFTRKNPQAIVEAFLLAFSLGTEHVKLKLKTMHGKYDKDFSNFSKFIKNDSRIELIDENLTKSELHKLYQEADVYISLHRSEGFGLTISEAMLYEKLIIASNYSGNKDFCHSNTCILIDGTFSKVKNNEYHNAFELEWFEADTLQASAAMLSSFKNYTEMHNIKTNARKYILTNYSIEEASNSYKKALETIWART